MPNFCRHLQGPETQAPATTDGGKKVEKSTMKTDLYCTNDLFAKCHKENPHEYNMPLAELETSVLSFLPF